MINTYWNKAFYEFLLVEGFTAAELVPFGALGIGSGGFRNLYFISALDMIRIIINGLEYEQQLYMDGISQLTDHLSKQCEALPNVLISYNSPVIAITRNQTLPDKIDITYKKIGSLPSMLIANSAYVP